MKDAIQNHQVQVCQREHFQLQLLITFHSHLPVLDLQKLFKLTLNIVLKREKRISAEDDF